MAASAAPGGPQGFAIVGCALGVRITFRPLGVNADETGLVAAGRAGKASALEVGAWVRAGCTGLGAGVEATLGVAPAHAVFGTPPARPPVILVAGNAGKRFEVEVLPQPPALPTAE